MRRVWLRLHSVGIVENLLVAVRRVDDGICGFEVCRIVLVAALPGTRHYATVVPWEVAD